MASGSTAAAVQKGIEMVTSTTAGGTSAGEALNADSLAQMATNLFSKLHSGGPEINIIFGVMALIIAFLTIALLVMASRRSSHSPGVMDALYERMESLEMALREQNHQGKIHPEVKGAVGYFKQELTDLRSMLFHLQQQTAAMEQIMGALESRAAGERAQPRRSPIARKPQDANFVAANRPPRESVLP